MSKDKSESKRKRGRPVKYVMPEPIDATPERTTGESGPVHPAEEAARMGVYEKLRG